MNQSKGINQTQLRSGATLYIYILTFHFSFSTAGKDLVNFLMTIKDKYPEFYNKKIGSFEKENVDSFDAIYD
jgi:hypothetical protein